MVKALQWSPGFRIECSIRNNWDRPAYSEWEGETVTYAEVARRIARIHAQLEALGVTRGDRVALVGRNSNGWAITFMGIITYGAVVVPILHEFKTSNICHIVNHSEAKVFYLTQSYWEAITESSVPHVRAFINSRTGVPFYIQGDDSVKIELARIQQRTWEEVTPLSLRYYHGMGDELAEINYTSGTTGFSKGVMQPYRALASNIEFASGVLDLHPGDTVISFLPLAHSYGQAFEFIYCFCRGNHIHFLTRTPSPKIIIEAFAAIKPRIILLVPLIVEKLYRNNILKILNRRGIKLLMKMPIIDKPVLRKFQEALTTLFGNNFIEVIIGGAALNPEVELFLKRIGFRYTVGFGMTECAPIITYASWATHKLYSSGRAVVNMRVKIDNPNPLTGVGEIVMKGDNVTLGYYKNPEQTAASFTPDSWFRSGDLGYLDPEGNLFIKGRSKNMILGPSGQNIYPEEIEALINNQPYVQESLVTQRDGKLIALVVPDMARLDAEGIEGITDEQKERIIAETLEKVNEELPAYSKIATVQLYPEEFEKTPKKSIKRYLYTK